MEAVYGTLQMIERGNKQIKPPELVVIPLFNFVNEWSEGYRAKNVRESLASRDSLVDQPIPFRAL